MKLIDPLKEFGSALFKVQSPSRYLGGEYGITVKPHDEKKYFNFGMIFPDLYEIGMSNMAVKILYNGLNSYDDIRCERAFAVDVDFEQLLKERNVPLYTLETGMPLYSLDMIGFSLGYELGITNILACLELGKIPVLAEERREEDPVIIAGGCGVTNPGPLSDFFDAIFIGEAENAFFELIEKIAAEKRNGKSREELKKILDEHPNVWTKQSALNNKTARKAFQNDFGLVPSVPSWFPLSNQKAVQDHGTIEIMRGCPNGCRFCHAGIYYRPQRIKNKKLIFEEADHLIFDAGYREVSLTSLSSADYPDIGNLLEELNQRYKGYNISFQLPSLKVNSMSLPILEKLSTVRKSGLTFAVETPEEAWQLSLNKEVYAQHLKEIILEAKQRGWSSAKFYFMIGLPVGDYFGKENNPTGKPEEETIVEFLLKLQAETRIQCNVNVGIFIPKAHTAYQWVQQITPEKAKEKLDYIFTHLPRGKFKVSRHNFDTTILEGLISRGDERVGKIIYSAYKKGARLDAWEEHLEKNMKYWNEAFDEADWNVKESIYRKWSLDEELPWDKVSLGPAKNFYKKEWERSVQSVLTPRCETDCSHPCGVCNKVHKVKVHTPEEVEKVSDSIQNNTVVTPEPHPECNIEVMYRVIFTFSRKNGAEYLAYLSQVELFHKAFLRSSLPVIFTQGFNPLPRIEFATAMSLGIKSDEEIASCVLYENCTPEHFINTMNKALPEILHIKKAFVFTATNLRKREALSEGLWGAKYRYRFLKEMNGFFESEPFAKFSSDAEEGFSTQKLSENEYEIILPFKNDKKFRVLIEEYFNEKLFDAVDVEKIQTLAKAKIAGWTHKDEQKLRGKDEENPSEIMEFEKQLYADYYSLYQMIADVNKQLIEDRKAFLLQKEALFSEHPELKEKYGK